MKKNIFLNLIGVFVSLIFYTQGFSVTLYDDFSGTSIKKNKWREAEWVREIDPVYHRLLLKQSSPSPVVIGTDPDPYAESNSLNFINPNSVNSIQAEVVVFQTNITNQAYPSARLAGRWYNDGTSSEGMIGDIHAEIALIGEPTRLFARWTVVRLTNPEGTTASILGSGDFTTTLSFYTAYTLYISYDNIANKFTFKVGAEELTFGPSGLPSRVGYPNSPWKCLGTRVQVDNSTSSGYISAAFDNVFKNGSSYDDFSSSTIDSANWSSYEFVREISAGKLRSKSRSSSAYTSFVNNRLQFDNPLSINIIQAKVTPLIFENPEGLSQMADISGAFYNDGTPGTGVIGDVVGQILIGGSSASPVAAWQVYKYTDPEGITATQVASGAFATPITLGNTYTLFLGWNGSQFTFKFDSEEANYIPVNAPVAGFNPVKGPFKRLRTIIYPEVTKKEATIEALFDDVNVLYKRDEIMGTGGAWSSGIWYYNVATNTWTKPCGSTPSGPIALGDVNGDGRAEMISVWSSGLWYQNGATLGWTKVYSTAPSKVTVGDITGDGWAEIIGTWSTGIWYWNVHYSGWTQMYYLVPSGPMAVGDVTGDGRADVVVVWPSGLWYQDGATLGWTKVYSTAPSKFAVGDITGDGRVEIITAFSSGIWYWNPVTSGWTKMSSSVPTGPMAVGDVTGDGKPDVVAVWSSGLWYQNASAVSGWTQVYSTAPSKIAVGDITGD